MVATQQPGISVPLSLLINLSIDHCPIKWEEASVLDHARNSPDLMIKEAIHIKTTPDNSFEQLNSDLLALGVKL